MKTDIYSIAYAEAATTWSKINMHLSRRDFIKTAGVIAGSTVLVSCGSREGSSYTEIDATPHPTFGIDVQRLNPERNLFLGEQLSQVQELKEIDGGEIKKYTELVEKTEDYKKLAGSKTVDGYKFIDKHGTERTVVVVFTHDTTSNVQSGMYMYAPFDSSKNSFVPPEEAPQDAPARLFPIGWKQNKATGVAHFGLVKQVGTNYQMTLELFMVESIKNADGTVTRRVTAYEPGSLVSYVIPDIDKVPDGAKKVLTSLTEVSDGFKEVLNKFKGSTTFELGNDGKVYLKPQQEGEEKTEIKGLVVNQDGSAVVSYHGKNPEINNEIYTIPSSDFAKNLTITGEGLLTVIDKDGVVWTFDQKTKTLFPETTKELDLNKPNIEVPMHTIFDGSLMSRFLSIEASERTCRPTGKEVPLLPNEIILLGDDNSDGIIIPFKLDPAKGPSGIKRQKRERDEMPVQIAAIYDFKDDTTGLKGQVIIERWSNNDRSLSYRMAINPERNRPLTNFITDVGYLNNNRFPSGFILADVNGLENFSKNSNLKDPQLFIQSMTSYLEYLEPGNTYKTLKETGNLSNENGIPIVITGSSVIR